jgi:hypothetical protein
MRFDLYIKKELMIPNNIFLAVLLTYSAAINTCSYTPDKLTVAGVFVGSTPCDSLIKSLLTIHPDTKADFMRWDVTFDNSGHKTATFVLNVAFGESLPNTPGFKENGEKLSFTGECTVANNTNQNITAEIYQLKSESCQPLFQWLN